MTAAVGTNWRRFARAVVAVCVVPFALAIASPAGAQSGAQSPTDCNQAFGQPPFVVGGSRVVAEVIDGSPVKVLLPSDYATSGVRYPVLYLFHGGQGNEDSWLNYSDVLQFTAPFTGNRAAIVVMPAGDKFFSAQLDWRNGREHWETLMISELIPFIDSHFHTIPDRAHRAIAGNSGGGFAATHLAARHPDLFVAAGDFSGLTDLRLASPAAETAFYGALTLENVCEGGGSPTDAGVLGDPFFDQVWWRNANPTDLAENFKGMSIYIASGNGIPCGPQDIPTLLLPIPDGETAAYVMNHVFDAALSAAGVAHTDDYYGCGTHSYPYFQRDLHVFWQFMLKAFGTPPPPSFNYSRADPNFSVWGWDFQADPNRAAEFLDIQNASTAGLTLAGTGTETVITPAFYQPGQQVGITGASPALATANTQGRITIAVDLGPADTQQEYAPGAPPPSYQTRVVRFTAAGTAHTHTSAITKCTAKHSSRNARHHRRHRRHARNANTARVSHRGCKTNARG